ncbi:ABC transporter substrate-binding protein [Acuticoccus sp.]|uniref:ABC transporter substrate-binding protein n=1 Tax=Acuticoccus sp. TaxID=1904378 RepID=UPI003B517D42
MIRRTSSGACRAACTAVLGGALLTMPASADTPSDTLVIGEVLDNFLTLDPAEIGEVLPGIVIENICDPLIFMGYDEPANLVPGLAESWEVSEDGRTYTFKIRDGLTFPSGNPVRAEDAAWSIHRKLKLGFGDAIGLTEWGFTAEEAEEQFQATDEYTLTVNAPDVFSPDLFLLAVFTSDDALVLDKEFLEPKAVDGDFANGYLKTNTACYGPFTLGTYRPGEIIVLDAIDDYFRHPIEIERVVLQHIPEATAQRLALERNDIDVATRVAPSDLDAIEANPDLRLVNILRHRLQYFSLNQKREVFNDPKVVEAFKYLVDYEGMEETVMRNLAVSRQAFVPIGAFGAIPEDDEPYSLDIEKAKALLAEAGHPDGFEVTMQVPTRFPYPDIAQHIQSNAAQAGITINLEPLEYSVVTQRERGREHDIALKGWGADYPDANAMATRHAWNPDNRDEAQLTQSPAWRTGYDTGHLSDLVMEARQERDAEKRAQMYEEMQREVLASSPIVYIFQRYTNIGVHERVKEYKLNTFRRFWAATVKE